MSFVTSMQEGPILTLTLNRPEALNALNGQVLDDLDAVLDAVDLDTVRCLILTGGGDRAFAAGADIAAMANMTPEEAAAFSRRGNEVFRRIETFPLPTVAAVNGYALGGGCELAMACDIRLCSENAVFGQPEVTLGITPGFGGTQRLMRLVGMGKAKELIFSARTVKAAEALSMGLVNAVYPPEELLPAARKLGERIARNAPIAVRACKAAMNEGMDLDMDEALDAEAKMDLARSMVMGPEYYSHKEIIRNNLRASLSTLDKLMANTRKETTGQLNRELSVTRGLTMAVTVLLLVMLGLNTWLGTSPLIRAEKSLRQGKRVPVTGAREFRHLAGAYNALKKAQTPEAESPEKPEKEEE